MQEVVGSTPIFSTKKGSQKCEPFFIFFHMNPEMQKHIAASFSGEYEEFDPELTLTATEFELFEKGIFSNSMDDKWHIFVIEDKMYLARSWTGYCIFKIHVKRHAE